MYSLRYDLNAVKTDVDDEESFWEEAYFLRTIQDRMSIPGPLLEVTPPTFQPWLENTKGVLEYFYAGHHTAGQVRAVSKWVKDSLDRKHMCYPISERPKDAALALALTLAGV
jgi:hypothetical protein